MNVNGFLVLCTKTWERTSLHDIVYDACESKTSFFGDYLTWKVIFKNKKKIPDFNRPFKFSGDIKYFYLNSNSEKAQAVIVILDWDYIN